MTAAWMAYALLVGALLALAARGLEGVCRLAGWPVRWVWAGAIALTIVFTALAPRSATPPIRFVPAALHTTTVAAVADASSAPTLAARLDALRHALAAPVRRALAGVQLHAPASLEHSLVTIWIALGALLLVLFVAVHLRYHRALRTWPSTDLHGVRVRLAPRTGPAVMGLARPEIVVPRWLLQRSAEEQRMTLAHEREHLRARDPLLLATGCVAAALLPWHPAVWWMLTRLRLSVELDCDARVLRHGVAPRSYGTLLVDLAEQCAGLGVGAAALADTSSHLERRLLAMKAHRPRFALARGSALAATAVVALLAACETQLPTAAEVEQMDVAAAERNIVSAQMLASMDSVVYIIDGRAMSAEEAHALDPERIARIEVLRAAANGMLASRRNEIRITTMRAAARDSAAAVGGTFSVRRKPGGAGGVFRVSADTIHLTETNSFTGLFVIDGVPSDAAKMNTLSPSTIKSIEVIKGPAATKLYTDPKAANGVIKITTKGGTTSR